MLRLHRRFLSTVQLDELMASTIDHARPARYYAIVQKHTIEANKHSFQIYPIGHARSEALAGTFGLNASIRP